MPLFFLEKMGGVGCKNIPTPFLMPCKGYTKPYEVPVRVYTKGRGSFGNRVRRVAWVVGESQGNGTQV